MSSFCNAKKKTKKKKKKLLTFFEQTISMYLPHFKIEIVTSHKLRTWLCFEQLSAGYPYYYFKSKYSDRLA